MCKLLFLILILTNYSQLSIASNATAGNPGTGASGTTGPAGTTGAGAGIRGSGGATGGYPPPSSGELPIKTPRIIPNPSNPPSGCVSANCPSYPPPNTPPPAP